MPVADNKALSRKLFEQVWNEGKTGLLEELRTPDFKVTDPYNPVTKTGVDAFMQYYNTYKTAFPDLFFNIDKQIAEGDFVVNFLTATGTHEGEFLGIPASHKKSSVACIVLLRFADGKIAETTTLWDGLTFLKNAGVLDAAKEAMLAHR